MALEGIFFIIISFSWALTVCEAPCACAEGTMRVGKAQEWMFVVLSSSLGLLGDLCHNNYLISIRFAQ